MATAEGALQRANIAQTQSGREAAACLRDLIHGVSDVFTVTEATTVRLDRSALVQLLVTGPASGTYAIALPSPAAPGQRLQALMVATTATNAVTIPVSTINGSETITLDAATEFIELVGINGVWAVVASDGASVA